MISETFGCAILDTGCSKSVCSRCWLNEFIETLSEKEKEKVLYSPSKTFFRFGDSRLYESKEKVKIPVKVAGVHFMINCDIIDAEIPLLLSKEAMKKANVIINLGKDEVRMFNRKVKVFLTKRGHYCIPLNKRAYLSKIETIPSHQVYIINIEKLESLSKAELKKIAMKWHKQFSHCDGDRLYKLLTSAGIDDENVKWNK